MKYEIKETGRFTFNDKEIAGFVALENGAVEINGLLVVIHD